MPTVNVSPSMSLKDALEGGFLPSMTEEEQKQFTPSELILYKHALEYRWTAEDLKKVINMLQENLPDKTGEKGKWNFEKARSILNKVLEIVLWGNSDNNLVKLQR